MKKTNKLISTIVALVMLIGMLPTISFAANKVSNLHWATDADREASHVNFKDETLVYEGIEPYRLYIEAYYKDGEFLEMSYNNWADAELDGFKYLHVNMIGLMKTYGNGSYQVKIAALEGEVEDYISNDEYKTFEDHPLIGVSDLSPAYNYTGVKRENTTTSKNDTTIPSTNTQTIPTSPATTNTAKVEVDASVISPEYAVAVKTMYHMGLMPNIYSNYNKNVTNSEFLGISNKIFGSGVNLSNNSEISAYDAVSYTQQMLGYKSARNAVEEMLFNSVAEKLLKDTGIGETRTITHEQLALLMYNALNINIRVQTKFSGIETYNEYEVSDETYLQKLGYTQADLDEIASRTDTPVYAETETTAPITTIKLTINNPVATVNGENITNDVAPIIRNSRTMLPVRFIVEALGGQVTWDGATSTVGVISGNINISLVVGADYATVNGEKITLDSPSFVQDGRTYLPLRFISEKLGANVVWDGDTQSVSITK